MKSSKPSIEKHNRLWSVREMMNLGKWSDIGGWSGEGVSAERNNI